MAKKTIDTSNWIASDTPTPTIDTSNWLPVETPIEQDFNIENVQKRFEQDKIREVQAEKSRELYDTRPEYAGLNKEEKEYLVKKEKEGKLVGEDLARAAWTMAGNDPMQRKVAEKDAKGNKIYSDLGELYKKGEEKGFFSSVLTDIELSKYSGGNYYMKDRGDGTLVPVPLAYNEKPEAKNVKDAQVFSSLDDDAYGDSRFVDIAKKAWNIIPAVAQGFVSIPEVAQGLITGKTGRGYEVAKDVLEAAKFKTSQEFQKGIIDTQKIDEFSDFLSKDVYDLSPDKIINTVVNVASSFGEFAVTRKFVPIGGKAGTFAAGTAMNIKEPLQAAEDAGVEGRAKYAVAATYALAASGLETALGIEGKIFDDAATTAKKQMINKIIKDNVEVVGGKLTKESVENLYKETLKEVPSFYAKYLKNTVGEVTEEVAQNMIQNATQEIHDIVMKDDPEAAKFNTKFWSPEALAEYMNSAFGGLIGGVAGSRFIKDKQSQTAYDAIKDGKENELKVQLVSGLKEGRLTQEDYDRAIFKIDSYKSYYDATKDRNVTDEERRKIFDLTYEKENTKSGIERLKQNNPGGINDELIATKEQQISDYSQQIKDIWAASEARTSEAPVEEAKAEAPAWKTSMDEFAKRVHNSDKYPSQNITTKDDAITALGLTPELNELSKGISIDFKAPHLPEGLGIRVRKGILYEPITIKQEGKDLTEERQLPTYLFEDKDGENWMLAVGQKTDVDAPDVTYLIKLDNEGNYEGHQEFKYETAKKNELTFDNLKDVFDEFNLKPVSTSNDAKAFTPPQAEFEEMEEVEYEDVIPAKEYEESGQFKEVYETVKGGLNRAKLKILPNGTVGLDIEGTDVPFASQRYLNKESLPQGDVQVVLETVENVDGKYGRGVVVKTLEGERLGYIRRAGKAKGKINLGKVSIDEDIVVDIPEMSDIAKEKIQQIEKDQEKYEFIQDELGRRYVDKNTREPYTSVTKYAGGEFSTKNENLKRTAFEIGNIVNKIVKDFFNGTIKAYSDYSQNMSRADYNDIVNQLQDVLSFAKDKGYSIVTKDLVIADDTNKIAGMPNVLMVDENGNFYVYDVTTLRNKEGDNTEELLNRRYEGKPSNADRISAQVNMYADILVNKYGFNVNRVGVIPFNVSYEIAKKGQPVKINNVDLSSRIDFKRKQILDKTGKTSAAEVKEKVEEIKPTKELTPTPTEIKAKKAALEGKPEEKPTEKKAEEKPKEVKPAEKEVVEGELPLDAKGRKVGNKEYKSGKNHVSGRSITRTAPNGTKIKGKYKLVPALELVPSHNPNSFAKNEEFPQTKEGKTINDRDYEKDKPAQGQVKDIAQNFSAAALDQSPIVSKEGIVYDGNNRTMSRQLAAQNNTDEEYLDELKERAEMYGFTAEDVDSIKNPTLVFEVEENLPFDTKTMAMFNVAEKKAQSPIQRAIAISKRLSDKAKVLLSNLYEQVDTPSEVTSNSKMMKEAVDILVAEGVIDSKEIPRYVNEIGTATADGTSFLEGVVMAATLNEDSIQVMSSEGMGDIKKMILSNIVGLMQNSAKGKDSLINEIAGAIQIMQKAKSLKISVTDFLSQIDAFNENNFTLGEMSMALLLNNKKPNELKGFLRNYNQDVGIESLFGEDTSKQAILDRLLNSIIQNYEKVKENIRAIARERIDAARRSGEQIEPTGEDVAEQKAKSVKSIFDEAVKLFYKIRGTEGAAKKRNLTQERKELMRENPSARFIDNNISYIFEQLEKQGVIKRKGNCP